MTEFDGEGVVIALDNGFSSSDTGILLAVGVADAVLDGVADSERLGDGELLADGVEVVDGVCEGVELIDGDDERKRNIAPFHDSGGINSEPARLFKSFILPFVISETSCALDRSLKRSAWSRSGEP